MSACRALTVEEVRAVAKQFRGTHGLRDVVLFLLCCETGLYVREALQVRRGMLEQALPNLHLSKETRGAVVAWLDELRHIGHGRARDYLFAGRRGVSRPVSTRRVRQSFAAAFRAARLQGSLGLGSTRKTFIALQVGVGIFEVQTLLECQDTTSAISCLGLELDETGRRLLTKPPLRA